MKIAADEMNAIPADANAMYEPGATTQDSLAKISATTVGIVDWKTIAPVILPIAKRVLALAHPDDGVELLRQLGRDRGDDEGEEQAVDVELLGEVLDGVDEEDRTEHDQPERDNDLEVHHTQPRNGGFTPVRASVDAMEPEWREFLGVHLSLRLEVPLDVPGVDPDEPDSDDPLEPDRLERQECCPDGECVGDAEVAHVVGKDARIDPHGIASRPLAR